MPWRSVRAGSTVTRLSGRATHLAEAAQLHQGRLQFADPSLERRAETRHATGVMRVDRIGVLELRHEAADVVALAAQVVEPRDRRVVGRPVVVDAARPISGLT